MGKAQVMDAPGRGGLASPGVQTPYRSQVRRQDCRRSTVEKPLGEKGRCDKHVHSRLPHLPRVGHVITHWPLEARQGARGRGLRNKRNTEASQTDRWHSSEHLQGATRQSQRSPPTPVPRTDRVPCRFSQHPLLEVISSGPITPHPPTHTASH